MRLLLIVLSVLVVVVGVTSKRAGPEHRRQQEDGMEDQQRVQGGHLQGKDHGGHLQGKDHGGHLQGKDHGGHLQGKDHGGHPKGRAHSHLDRERDAGKDHHGSSQGPSHGRRSEVKPRGKKPGRARGVEKMFDGCWRQQKISTAAEGYQLTMQKKMMEAKCEIYARLHACTEGASTQEAQWECMRAHCGQKLKLFVRKAAAKSRGKTCQDVTTDDGKVHCVFEQLHRARSCRQLQKVCPGHPVQAGVGQWAVKGRRGPRGEREETRGEPSVCWAQHTEGEHSEEGAPDAKKRLKNRKQRNKHQ